MKNASFFVRLGNALQGISSALKSEASLRFQVLAAFGAYGLLFTLGAPAVWWALFTLTIAGVLSTELLNSSLETLMDHLHPQIHPAIKKAKDIAAGAVLIFSLSSLAILTFFLLSR